MNNTTQQCLHKLHKCLIQRTRVDGDAKGTLLTVISAILMPLVIGANFLIIFGIIKTKLGNFSSPQILFLTLFLNDLIISMFQLPTTIYINWKSSFTTCFEIRLANFFIVFPISMSVTLLFVTSIDRYVFVMHSRFHRRYVTRTLLTIIIILVTLISITGTLLHTLLCGNRERTKFYIALAVYSGILVITITVVNMALLKFVKQKLNNMAVRKAKTIIIMVVLLVIAYLPFTIRFAIVALTEDKKLIEKTIRSSDWILIPPQINAVLNSVLFLVRNSRMRHHFYNLLHFGGTKINSRQHHPSACT